MPKIFVDAASITDDKVRPSSRGRELACAMPGRRRQAKTKTIEMNKKCKEMRHKLQGTGAGRGEREVGTLWKLFERKSHGFQYCDEAAPTILDRDRVRQDLREQHMKNPVAAILPGSEWWRRTSTRK